MEEEAGDLPDREEDEDSDREEDDRLFAWMVNDDLDEEEEDEVEEEQLVDTEASELMELDAPAERSGHIAVVDRNIMYVWGGYKVSYIS